jgi:hypothetical protein
LLDVTCITGLWLAGFREIVSREEIDKERFRFRRAVPDGKGSSGFSISNVVLAL